LDTEESDDEGEHPLNDLLDHKDVDNLTKAAAGPERAATWALVEPAEIFPRRSVVVFRCNIEPLFDSRSVF